MPAYLVRWPNGPLTIAAADDTDQLFQELLKDDVSTEEAWESPHGMVIEVPKGFRLHFPFSDHVELIMHSDSDDSIPTFECWYPHITAAMKVGYKTRKAAMAAAKEAVEKERQGLK